MAAGQTTKKSYIIQFGLQSDIAEKMREIDSSTKETQKTLNLIKTNLKGNWDSSRFQEAQKLAQKSLDQTREKLANLRSEFERISSTPDGIENKEYKLENLKKEIIATENQVQRFNKQLAEVNNMNLDRLIKQWETVGDRLDTAANKTKYLSAAAAGGLFASAKAAMDYESAFAGVEQMVEGTDTELQQLNTDIREMALETPQSATALADIAKSAGQLGVSTPYVADFTKMVADLVSVTDLSADEGAANLAKFANIIQMDETYYNNLGSTILELGKSASSTETEIVDMSQRIAATGNLTGLTAAQILAISTALSDLGIEAEAGGTAISKLLRQMQIAVATGNQDLQSFASVAGTSASEFAAAFEEDAAGALAQFIQGLQNAEKSGESATVILNDMGLSEVRLSNAILALTSSGDLLTQHLATANQAWEENTALTDTANQKYQTTAAQLQLAKNAIVDVGISLGESLLPMVTNAAAKVQDLAEWFNSLDDSTQRMIVSIGLFTALLSPSLKITGAFADVISNVIKAYRTLKPATDAATGSQVALNAAQAASPAGALVTAISGVIAVLGAAAGAAYLTSQATETLSDKINQVKEDYESATKSIEETQTASEAEVAIVEELIPRYDELNNKTDKTAAEKQELQRIVEQINSIWPDTIELLDEETWQYNQQTAALKDLCEQKREDIRLTALRSQALKAQEGILEIQNKFGVSSSEELAKKLMEANDKVASMENSGDRLLAYIGNNAKSYEYLEQLDEAKANVDAITEALILYAQLEEQVNQYTEDTGTTTTNYTSPPGNSASGDGGSGSNTQSDYEYNVRLNEHWYKMGEISTKTYLENLKRIRSAFLQEGTEEWMTLSEQIHSVEQQLADEEAKAAEEAAKAAEEAAKAEEERREQEYNDKRKRLDYEHSVGLISEQEYLQALIALQEEYLEEYTDEWYSVAKEIYNLQQSMLDAQAEALDEAAQDYKDFADDMIDKAQEEADAKIQAIDDEIAARQKLKEQQQSETELAEARLRLERETDEYNRLQIQKQIDQMEQDLEEQRIQDEAEAEKESIQAQVEEIQAMVESSVEFFNKAIEQQKAALGIASETKESVAYQIYNEQYFNGQNLTPAQLESLMYNVAKKMLGGI